MSELTGKSPGVSTREIDLSKPTGRSPQGIPAGVVGTSIRGPAFVPVTFATYQDFVSHFGATDGEKFGPLAVSEWMKNSTAGSFIRLLGTGDGKRRDTADGAVTNAGFTVGQKLVQPDGLVGENPHTGPRVNGIYSSGSLGRTYVLGCFMSQSDGSNIFTDSGIAVDGEAIAQPIIRGIIFAPSGVVPALSSSYVGNNSALSITAASKIFGGSGVNARNGGAALGDVITGSARQTFVMLLNGHKQSAQYPSVITASFDPGNGDKANPSYFAHQFNTDPYKIEEAGHYLYTSYDIRSSLAVITGSGYGGVGKGLQQMGPRGVASRGDRSSLAFLMTGSMARATSAATDASNVGVPDFESFTDRYTTAKSPFVVSQKFGGSNKNIFRVHARDDGAVGNTAIKITIGNVSLPTKGSVDKFGNFDLYVRKFDNSDYNFDYEESFLGLSLDPSSPDYISRRIGDTRTFYDFDRKDGSQKLVVEGKYPNVSQFIRIEEASDLNLGNLDDSAVPTGFRGIPHLVTSGTFTDGTTTVKSALTGTIGLMNKGAAATDGFAAADFGRIVQPPVPMRHSVSEGTSPNKQIKTSLTWGIQFDINNSKTEPNKNGALEPTIAALTKYLPDYHISKQNPVVSDNEGIPDLAGCVRDSDKFNNNLFTLERIEVLTSSADVPDKAQWVAAAYRRNGIAVGELTDKNGNVSTSARFIDPSKDFANVDSQKYFKFTFPLQGGFDGLNIFDRQKYRMSDVAVRREMTDSTNQGGVSGPTVASIRKAIDVMEQKSDVDIKLLAIPGIRHESITDYAIDAVEDRFDAMLIMDVEEKDGANEFVTGSEQNAVVGNTVDRFASRALDTSFAAAYFPDVIMQDPTTLTNVQVPPSVAVLGAFSLNDAISHPWFAPAGFTRGALQSVIEAKVPLKRVNMDSLYTVDINPITSFASSAGTVVFGQKTLLAAASALDRVNVRRLLIDVRRKVKDVARGLLFEPNREDTLTRFSSAVVPILTDIQADQGLDRFKVQIDTSTTTQADVENNTIRGKIFLQPTKSVEFISLDFVVSNTGE
jgi:phage tail sheath protein FI